MQPTLAALFLTSSNCTSSHSHTQSQRQSKSHCTLAVFLACFQSLSLSTLQRGLPCNHLPCKGQLATRYPLCVPCCRRLWLGATARSPSRSLSTQDSCRFKCESRVRVACPFIACRGSSPHRQSRLQSLVAYRVSIPCRLSPHVPVDRRPTEWFGGMNVFRGG